MPGRSLRQGILFTTTAFAAIALGQPVWAQAQPAPPAAPAAPPAASADVLGEVVVTATRQADTVSRVPLTIAAVTQKSIDQQGIKNVQDLARTVPAVTFRYSGTDNVPNVSIRGISSALGAATTGVYLDDAPLQKFGTIGVVTGGGPPFPVLYDLERVEVLKGPQGTLFGSSSEGGTVRFITPSPSLTTYSGSVRADVSLTKTGSPSYEAGGAIGGPIIEDKLGFRLSLFDRHTGGWIDHVSLYDGHMIDKNADDADQRAARLSIAWQVTDKLLITANDYYSYDHIDDVSTFNFDIPQFTVNPGYFSNLFTLGTGATAFNLQFPSVYYPGGTFGPYNQYGVGKSYNAFYLDTAHEALPMRSPRTTRLHVPSISVDYDFGGFSAKLISSYIYDRTFGPVRTAAGLRNNFNPPPYGSFVGGDPDTHVGGQYVGPCAVAGQACAGSTAYTVAPVVPGQPFPASVPGGMGAAAPFVIGYPLTFTDYEYENVRRNFVEELRFQSKPSDSPFSWVAGLYYSKNKQRQPGSVLSNEGQIIQAIRGIDEGFGTGIPNLSGTIFNPGTPQAAQIPFLPYGTDPATTPCGAYFATNPTGPASYMQGGRITYNVVQVGVANPSCGSDVSRRLATLDVTEYAAYAEGNYAITDRLKLILGARYSSTKTSYTQTQSGPVFNAPLNLFTPTLDHPFPNQVGDPYQNSASGSLKEHPFNPKVELSWQATSTNLFYALMSRGTRTGGVNTPGTLAQCVNDIAALGGPTPLDYAGDKVTNYELGAKVRLFGNRVSLNTSAFYLDWKDPQLTVTLRCAFQYVTNANSAVSKGADFEGAIQLFKGFVFNFSGAYTDAYYNKDFGFRNATGGLSLVVKKGQGLNIPKWQFNVGAQYSFDALGKFPAYVRADYQYSGRYDRGPTDPSVAGYNGLTLYGSPTNYVTARAGATFNKVDVSLYVKNLTNSQNLLSEGIGSDSPIITGTTFRPREIGMQLNYRY